MKDQNKNGNKMENSLLKSYEFSLNLSKSVMQSQQWYLIYPLGWEDPLEEGMATHSNILAWRTPMDRGGWQATVHGVTKNQTQIND